MPMYNLIEYSDNYSKKSGILWRYCSNEPASDANNATTNSFEKKKKITGKTDDNVRTDVKLMVPLKYLSNFWRSLEMLLINCEINLDLNWSKKCVILATNAD